MKKIKKFINFINEELNPNTYKSASNKLIKKGHLRRGEKLRNFVNKEPYINENTIMYYYNNEKIIIPLNNIEIKIIDSKENIYNDDINFINNFNFKKNYLYLKVIDNNKNIPIVDIRLEKNNNNDIYIEQLYSKLIDRKSAYKISKILEKYFTKYFNNLKINVNDLYTEKDDIYSYGYNTGYKHGEINTKIDYYHTHNIDYDDESDIKDFNFGD